MEATTFAAFVAAGVALVVGLTSSIVGAQTAKRTQQHQRRLASEERLWQRRAETYVELLQWAGPGRTSDDAEITDPSKMKELADNFKMPTELHARMTAFASGTVFAAAMEFIGATRTSMYTNATLLSSAESGRPEDALKLTGQAAMEAAHSDFCADRMAQLISDDLHGLIEDDQGRVIAPTAPKRPKKRTWRDVTGDVR